MPKHDKAEAARAAAHRPNARSCLLRAIATAAVATVPAAQALAQTAPDPSLQGEALQRQQQQQINRDQTRILTSPNGQTVIEVPTHEKGVAAPGTCRDITQITFASAPHMGDKARAKLIAPYLGRCLGLGDVENLLSDITRFYIEASRPTTRVYIKPQSLASGILVLEIVEGRVEKVTLEDGGRKSVNLTTAFGAVGNDSFNLRVFEQGLDQINRLSSNHASLNILPGSTPGDSVVQITNQPTRRLHLILSSDNTGQPDTGRYQGSASAIADNLLGLNDLISFTRRQAIPDGRPNADSRSNSALFSVPYSLLTLTLGFNNADYRSQAATGTGTVFILTGDTRNIFGRVDAAVWRNRHSKFQLGATLTGKRNRNYIDGNFLSVSSRKLTVLDVDANFSTLLGRGSLKIGVGWSKGLSWFSALDDARVGVAAGDPHAQFDKISGHFYFNMPFRAAGQDLAFASQVDGQYAFDPLYSSERIVIGSPFTVRGFLTGSLISDHGVYSQNDLTAFVRTRIGKQAIVLTPHVGLDAGYVAGIGPGATRGFLAGASGGLGASIGRVSLDVTASQQIARNSLTDENTLVFFRATVGF